MYLYILTLVLNMLEARNEAPSAEFSFSFFFFGMCYLRRLFTLLKGQVGKIAMEASRNTYTYLPTLVHRMTILNPYQKF